ncbi:hypothetical protein PIB30_099933 [Stylosanthes scabra]|uniref:Uncharacterized protein n=1 Tax=Stylosanthes scabra TaxID=79078 RepID=A0ABU6VXC9_9FABA|nr:hypothetical protein [Stylosanthes scabra]
MFGLGQAKSKTRSHTHPHNFFSHPPPTRFPTSSTNITHLAPQPIPKPFLKSRLAWPQCGQGHPTTLSSLVSFFHKPVSCTTNDEENKLGTENKETEEETEKQKKKQRNKTEEEEYKKQRKQKPRASLGEHRSRLDQVITWSKRDTHWKEGSSTPPSSSRLSHVLA